MTLKRLFFILTLKCIFSITLLGQVDNVKLLKAYYKTNDEKQCLNLWSDSSNPIKQIILIRHGEPDLNKKGWRNRNEAIKYMHDYDSVGVKPFNVLPICIQNLQIESINHSNVPRAVNTAQRAFDGFQLIGSSDFREFERKTMKFCNISLPLKFWTGGSRILWLMGMNKKDIESFKQAKERANNNAVFLSARALSDGTVILVAHGLHNKYVKKYLRKMGWKKVFDNGNGYLSVKVMAKD